MSSPQKIRVAIVGCGNIADRYAERILTYPTCELVGFSDLDPARARAFAAKFGGRAYDSLAQMLADPSIALVVNLTIHFAHYEVVKQCLLAGKHVHTEKPLALRYADAKELVDLAAARGLRLGSAPITYMGEAQQTAWKLLRSGKAGPVRLVYADINHGRIEAWHPNPEPFYEVGIQWDVGVYPLTLLTTMFGPVRRVTATGKVVYPHRVTKEGRKFTITTPDYVLAMLEFEAGLTARLSANFYVAGGKQGGGIEFNGDLGSVYLGSFQGFNASVEFAPFGGKYEPVPLIRSPFEGVEFARAVDDMTQAMLAGRPQRASGSQAAHVVEILEAVGNSMKNGGAVAVNSSFVPPAPMDWAQ
ncbi:MAG TPA: Gfo/Idh/MocA family oxidoreductase [Opitutaceae bacterium]|nr:Gfo/Idh/MocA family oxidoreductase [Opitutaceae bacterium]HND59954.1 Gfo/Idh/MocA family oxidoreductase [Opitutaceae bacterium]